MSSIEGIHLGILVGENCLYEIPHFKQVSVLKPRQEVVHDVRLRTIHRKNRFGGVLKISRHDRAFRAYNFGSNVVPIAGLHIVLNRSERSSREFQIQQRSVDIIELRNLRKHEDAAIGVNLSDLVIHQPASQVELVHRGILKEHSIYTAGHVTDGWRRGIACQ